MLQKRKQQNGSMAIGIQAGEITQEAECIAIGENAGRYEQGAGSQYAIALGVEAGYTGQNGSTIAIGNQAGYDRQNIGSIAIGYSSAGNVLDKIQTQLQLEQLQAL